MYIIGDRVIRERKMPQYYVAIDNQPLLNAMQLRKSDAKRTAIYLKQFHKDEQVDVCKSDGTIKFTAKRTPQRWREDPAVGIREFLQTERTRTQAT